MSVRQVTSLATLFLASTVVIACNAMDTSPSFVGSGGDSTSNNGSSSSAGGAGGSGDGGGSGTTTGTSSSSGGGCLTCTSAGKNCGTIADGCGNDLDCGATCSVAGETCGGAGVPNLCGAAEFGTTYYVREDGGDFTQCDGKSDAAYSGSGSAQPCAWKHPFIALPPGKTARIAGGDKLVIANGSYMMGAGAPETAACSPYPWDCFPAPIPSGPDAAHPTRIVGAGAQSGCAEKPELWGNERAAFLLDLQGTNNAVIDCLELTDRSECVQGHSGGIKCERDSAPYGKWADAGIRAVDSSNVVLRHLDVHGLASNGLRAGRLNDWTLEDVRIAANGWAGWDGDVGGSGSSNTGTIAFKRVTVEYNGCGETYPDKKPIGCWGQTAGGYGDGLGTANTGGDWIIEDSVFSHNTSDGLDLLYHHLGGTITIERSRFEGNAGNQVKTSGETFMRNNLVVSNCAYFKGQPFTHHVDDCRASGNAVSLSVGETESIKLTNNTLYSEGDCILLINGGACDFSPHGRQHE